MSKMSTIQMELAEQASDLGFASIEEAEANGYIVDYNGKTWVLKPDVNRAYKEKEEEEKKNKEAKQVETVWRILGNAKEAIAMVYRPEDKACSHPADDITDEKINKYYFDLNSMCCELSDRNVMLWQKEDEDENQD